MQSLTHSQKKVFRFILDFAKERGFPPSVREIGEALGGIKSSTVAYYIKVLARKGVLERGSSRPRDLRLATSLSTHGISGAGSRAYPLLGQVPAGRPNLMEVDAEDTFWLDERLGRTKDSYLLRVKGDSMIGSGILDGDLVLVRPQKMAEIGEIVVANTPDGEGTVKTFQKRNGVPFLQATNPSYPDISLPFEIVGKVVSVIRQL